MCYSVWPGVHEPEHWGNQRNRRRLMGWKGEWKKPPKPNWSSYQCTEEGVYNTTTPTHTQKFTLVHDRVSWPQMTHKVANDMQLSMLYQPELTWPWWLWKGRIPIGLETCTPHQWVGADEVTQMRDEMTFRWNDSSKTSSLCFALNLNHLELLEFPSTLRLVFNLGRQ